MFYWIIQGEVVKMRDFILWLFCLTCECDTGHCFIGDEGIFEIYRCPDCGKLVKFAVR